MQFALKTMLTIAVAATMTAPIAQAEWFAFGSFEPDTSYDLDWMFTDPPSVGENKVYFNVIPTTRYGLMPTWAAINPNVGALHTRVEPTNIERHHALFGVWKDCNGDGYVGMAEGALREYSAALLSSTVACPPVNGGANVWEDGAHNYNGWVSEFVPIVRIQTQNMDKRTYYDEDARVWGDFHRPDERPTMRSCALSPQPRGTYHNTGGLINYFECRAEQNGVNSLGTFNGAVDAIGDPAGLRFADDDDARSGKLGQVPIGGDESSSNAAVYTSDCSSSTRVGDVLNSTPAGPFPTTAITAVHNLRIYNVQPSATTDPSRVSIAGQVNATVEERADDCNYSNDFGHDLYNGVCAVVFCVAERDFNGVNPNNKLEADWNFNVSAVVRGSNPYALTGSVTRWNGFSGPPADNGVGFGGTLWLGDSTWLSKLGPRTVRVDLGSGGVALSPAYHLSFYAHVSQATRDRGFALPSATSGTYGSWHCGANTSGIHNGWNCDSSQWYKNPDGSFPSDPFGTLAKPGWKYELRDVDCRDGSLGDIPAGVQPAYYGERPCAPPS